MIPSWPGETAFLIGGGPSLTPADVASVRGQGRVIAINDAYRLAPWADLLYACDQRWWTWHQGVSSFTGPRFGLHSPADPITWPHIQMLQNTGPLGLERDPSGVRTGLNSGYQAINLAVHCGVARIILLGYDLCRGPRYEAHWFGEHPDGPPSPYDQMREAFETLVAPLSEIPVEVINCSRRTALGAFPCRAIEGVLKDLRERAA